MRSLPGSAPSTSAFVGLSLFASILCAGCASAPAIATDPLQSDRTLAREGHIARVEPKEAASEGSVVPVAGRELRCVVRVVGRPVHAPVRGTIQVAYQPDPIPLSGAGEFVLRDVPGGLFHVDSRIEGALDGHWLQAFDPQSAGRVVEWSVRPVHDVIATVVHADGSAIDPDDERMPSREDLRVAWTECALVPSECLDASKRIAMPDPWCVGLPSRAGDRVLELDSTIASRLDQPTALFAEHDVFATLVLGDVVLDSQRVTPQQPSVALRADRSDLAATTGTVEVLAMGKHTHRPVEGARIELRAQDGAWSLSRTTDVEGRARFARAPVGTHTLTASLCPQCFRSSTEIAVSPGRDVTRLTLDVEALGTLTGRVSPGATALADVLVECRPIFGWAPASRCGLQMFEPPDRRTDWPDVPVESWKRYDGVVTARVDANGRFEFTDVPAGEYALRARSGSAAGLEQSALLTEESPTDIVLSGP